jgi:hypothetical protein
MLAASTLSEVPVYFGPIFFVFLRRSQFSSHNLTQVLPAELDLARGSFKHLHISEITLRHVAPGRAISGLPVSLDVQFPDRHSAIDRSRRAGHCGDRRYPFMPRRQKISAGSGFPEPARSREWTAPRRERPGPAAVQRGKG